jgi:hypothetical protein
MRSVACAAVLALLFSAGCSDDTVAPDTGVTTDTNQVIDTTQSEGGTGNDQAVADAAASDATAVDAATADAASPDAAVPDAAVPDAALPDAVVKLDMPTGCTASKINFTQANTSKFELWELCFTANDTATEALIKKIDSTASCKHSGGGIAAKCPTGTWRCMGALSKDPVTKVVTAAAWKQLCQMSVLPAVSKIVGGYYI